MEVGNKIQVYDGQFRGNILVVGKTGSGKTYFIQQLAVNNFFDDIQICYWVSGVSISLAREAEIQSSFACPVEFFNVNDYEDLNLLINNFKERNEDTTDSENNVNNNIYRENKKLDHPILMDDLSGIAESPRCDFANFLTVSRKHRYNVVYAFHVIKSSREIWQKIISQTASFNIFPKSVPLIQYLKFYLTTALDDKQNISHYVTLRYIGFS